MKTAISIPDEIFADADAMAEKMGVSRSEFYTRAIVQYLAFCQEAEITAQLNALYPPSSPPYNR
jgi:metal-responsive CopG/Arc/MetJ family transcriptional regulator